MINLIKIDKKITDVNDYKYFILIRDIKKMRAVTRALRAETFLVSPLKVKRQRALLLNSGNTEDNTNFSVLEIK